MELPLSRWWQSHCFPEVTNEMSLVSHEQVHTQGRLGFLMTWVLTGRVALDSVASKIYSVPYVPISIRCSQFMFNIIATRCVDTWVSVGYLTQLQVFLELSGTELWLTILPHTYKARYDGTYLGILFCLLVRHSKVCHQGTERAVGNVAYPDSLSSN